MLGTSFILRVRGSREKSMAAVALDELIVAEAVISSASEVRRIHSRIRLNVGIAI